MTTETTPVGAGESSPALDGSAMIPDCLINGYINHLSWSDQATDREKMLVAGNIRGFAAWLRTHMYGLYTPIYAKPNAPDQATAEAAPEAGCSARLTAETPCTTPGCKHVFKPVHVLYGSKAFSKCPECGTFMDTPFQGTPNNSISS